MASAPSAVMAKLVSPMAAPFRRGASAIRKRRRSAPVTLVTAPPLSVLGSGWIEPSSRPAAAERMTIWVSVSFMCPSFG